MVDRALGRLQPGPSFPIQKRSIAKLSRRQFGAGVLSAGLGSAFAAATAAAPALTAAAAALASEEPFELQLPTWAYDDVDEVVRRQILRLVDLLQQCEEASDRFGTSEQAAIELCNAEERMIKAAHKLRGMLNRSIPSNNVLWFWSSAISLSDESHSTVPFEEPDHLSPDYAKAWRPLKAALVREARLGLPFNKFPRRGRGKEAPMSGTDPRYLAYCMARKDVDYLCRRVRELIPRAEACDMRIHRLALERIHCTNPAAFERRFLHSISAGPLLTGRRSGHG